MNKRIIGASFFLLFVGLIGAEIPDLSKYRDFTAEKFTEPVLVENFDTPLNGWTLDSDFKLAKGEGVNGTAAACYERKDPRTYQSASKTFKVEPGITYRLRLDYRTQLAPDKFHNIMEIVSIRFLDRNGKPLTGSFLSKNEQNQSDWGRWVMTFRPPSNAEKAKLSLLLRTYRKGKIWYDNIVVEPVEHTSASMHFLEPKMLNADSEGRIALRVVIHSSKLSESSLAVVVKAPSVKPVMLPVRDGLASGKLGKLPEGEIKVATLLIDQKSKSILAKLDTLLFIRSGTGSVKGAVTFDADGTTLVDGKPFLPIGIFAGYIEKEKDPDALDRIAKAGFNCVLSIGLLKENFYGGRKTDIRSTMRASLDELEKHHLKHIFAIKHQQYMRPEAARFNEFFGVRGLDPINTEIINAVKDHPALLAWYISDENPISELPGIIYLRNFIARLDPNHPSLTLTNKIDDIIPFAKTGDVFLSDAYPVGNNGDITGAAQTMSSCRESLLEASKLGMPVWWVPQIFAWGSFRDSDRVQRYPTEEEIRSMVLEGAVRGVKGYLLYAYHPIFSLSEKKDPGKSRMQWDNVVPSVRMLNALAPFLLSKEKAPRISVRQISGSMVEARAFRHGGQTRVIVTALGPGASEAVISISGTDSLASEYGRTENLGGGNYRFKGLNISSDILK